MSSIAPATDAPVVVVQPSLDHSSSATVADTATMGPPTAATVAATTEPVTVAPTTSVSADTDITKPAVAVGDEVPAVTWYQCACAEASVDKAAASSAKADVNRLVGGAAMRAVLTKATRMWDNGSTLTYTFVAPKAGNTIQQNKVKTVVQEWEKYANVKFTFVATGKATIRITFDPTSGSWSYVGNEVALIKPNEATMNLGWIGSSSTTITADEKGVILHEFGHTLGLMHEHQSPVRGGTLTLKESAVIEFYKKTQGWTEQEVHEQILNVYNVRDVSNYSALDVKSIMMYFMPAAMNEQNLEIKPNNVLSDIDKAFVTINYPYPSTHTPADSIWTMDYALGVAGVDAETKAAILVQYGLSEWSEVRYLFSGFSTSTRRANSVKPLQVNAGTSDVVPSSSNAVSNPKANPQSLAASPSRGLEPPVPARGSTPSGVAEGNFLEVIVNSLKQVFAPTTGQCFAFQFPGRFLQQDLYAWDTSAAGIYGQFVKPTVVNESEFRLVDQLYNVGEVVGAPNGQNLSICYEQVLNNLVPGHENDSRIMAKQQDQIRRWLMKDVPAAGWVKDLIQSQHTRSASLAAAVGSRTNPDGEPVPQFAVANRLTDEGKVNRMELAEALMEEYLSAKQVWELERDALIKSARANNEDMEDITRKLAHITSIREAQLAAKHADAVVRGYSHTIRQYLGYMDIKSPSEMLQDAKDAFREAATSSLDGALNIYPVQMSPIDWFQGLSTSFTMEDLTSDPEIILQQINAKSKLLDLLQSRLAALNLSPKNDIKALQSAVDAAQSTYSKAQSELQRTYTSNVISLAQSFVSAANVFQYSAFAAKALQYNILDSAFTGIEAAMNKTLAAHDAVNSASRAYSQALSAVTLAEATDTSQEITTITLQIDVIRREITELTTRVQALRASPPAAGPGQPGPLDDASLFPEPASGTAGGSRWQEIILYHKTSKIRQTSSTEVKSSVSASDVSFFWGSKRQSSTSSAEDLATANSESFDVEIGFRATMVTVDRGGWFQPQFFKQSSGFYHIDKKIFASKWPEGIESMEDLRKANSTQWEKLNKGLFPAYPVGYIICKDITIKVKMTADQLTRRSGEFANSAESSSGIFCWSTSQSSNSKRSEKDLATNSASDGLIIRIPGPQILGYMLQYVDNDLTQDLRSDLPDDFLIPDSDYEAGFSKPKAPARALAGPSVTDPSTDTPAAATAAVSAPKEEPVYASGYYLTPKARA